MKGLRYALAAVIVVALTNKGLSGDVPTNEVMRVGVYRGVLVYIKCLTPQHRADIDDIRVSVMEREPTERTQRPR